MYRATKSARQEIDKTKPSLVRKYISSPEKAFNRQKHGLLKELLIRKFKKKYGTKDPQILENEITNFIEGGKVSDIDLQRLDKKLKNILESKENNNLSLKSSHNRSLLKNTKTKNNSQTNLFLFPKIREKKNLKNSISNQNLIKNTEKNEKTEKNESDINLSKQLKDPIIIETPKTSNNRYRYRNPAEELAELEAEFTLEEEKKRKLRKNYSRIEFKGDQWNVLAQYNRKLYEKQLKEEKQKDYEIKKRTKEDLDYQIKQKEKREYEEILREKAEDKVFQEHLKHIDEMEKERQEAIKKKIMLEKKTRDTQVKDGHMRKRIDFLIQRKFEKNYIKKIQEEIDREKEDTFQKRKKEKEALRKVLKDFEINKEKQKELLQKKKEEDKESCKEMERCALKIDLERKRFYEKIRNSVRKFKEEEVAKLVNKIKQEKKDEDEQIYKYMLENIKMEEEKEKQAKIKKYQDRKNMKKFYDMQVEEKKKEMDFEKALDNEQGRIWNMDYMKFKDEEKKIKSFIKDINKDITNTLKWQMEKKKEKKRQSMSFNEYAMNREALENAEIEMNVENH